jgi:hypothetical protein
MEADESGARPSGMRDPNRGEDASLSTSGLALLLPAMTVGPLYWTPWLAMVADHDARFTPDALAPM